MGKINVLDFQVANLIAAGEVVDRPAAVVKELLENAIDSGADTVTVEIKRGGVSFIRVSDNGCGIAREDVPVALKRHATSKIREAADLDSIMTLGFRGEALAAIAAVSELRIMTKRPEDATGTLLESAGGRVSNITDAGCPDGTSVIVENLFFNTPARLKFLKKDGTEAANVAAYVEKIALSHPEINIRFIIDGELKYATAGDGNRKSAIYAVLGRDFSKKSMEIRGGFDGVTVTGYIGTPENVRGNRNLQIFFINDRFIRSKTVSAALEQAFTTYIPSDKFPCAVLYLQMNPASVDVNVHPAKLEVKFANERVVFESVYYSVRGALENGLSRPELKLFAESEKKQAQRELLNPFVPTKEGRGGEKPSKEETRTRTLEDGIQTVPAKTEEDKPTAQTSVSRIPPSDITPKEVRTFTEQKEKQTVESSPLDDLVITVPAGFGEEYEKRKPTLSPYAEAEQAKRQADAKAMQSRVSVPPPPIVTEAKPVTETVQAKTEEKPETAPPIKEPIKEDERTEHPVPAYRMVGELFQCYVVLEMGDTMYLVDKHAAHERILFEQLKRGMQAGEQSMQVLLIPMTLPLTSSERQTAEEYRDEIMAAGFDYTLNEEGAVLLQIPSFLSMQAASDAFCETVTRLSDDSGTASLTRTERYEQALFQASCKAAIKAGRDYDAAHLKWICDRVLSDPEIRYCPHGRPVCFTMTKSAIEGRFGRT